jgi:hypothetical protein
MIYMADLDKVRLVVKPGRGFEVQVVSEHGVRHLIASNSDLQQALMGAAFTLGQDFEIPMEPSR